MTARQPIQLRSFAIQIGSGDFTEITQWPFGDRYVTRLLLNDIPQRVRQSNCLVLGFRDPDEQLVGFGTLCLCQEYGAITGGLHSYIPLLAVNPAFLRLGHGRSIVEHLIEEAAVLSVRSPSYSPYLLLDVYEDNQPAIGLYASCGFKAITDPISDPEEGGKNYVVMARQLKTSPVDAPPSQTG